MTTEFLHGVEVVEIDTGGAPIQTVASSIIGMVGTAPDSAAAETATLTLGSGGLDNELLLTAVAAGANGNLVQIALVAGGPSRALSVAVDTTGYIFTVQLATDSSSIPTTTGTLLLAALIASTPFAALVTASAVGTITGIGGALRQTPLAGGADAPFPLDTCVICTSLTQAAALGVAGTLYNHLSAIFQQGSATVVVIRVAASETLADTVANVIGSGSTGMQAFIGCESRLGIVPRILCAPEFTEYVVEVSEVITGAPVVAAFAPIADALRAVVIADCPNTTTADAVAYRNLIGDARVYCHFPHYQALVNGVAVSLAASSFIAGIISANDQSEGFWVSPSNSLVNGIVGLDTPIDFVLGDVNSTANYLNSNQIATTIRNKGYVLWGNRGCSADPRWSFLSVRRTADLINDSVMRAFFWAIDRNITKTFVSDVLGEVNAYIRTLVALGAVIDGNAWADPSLNTPETVSNGQVYFDFDFTAPFPAEHITFRSHMTNAYLTELFTLTSN